MMYHARQSSRKESTLQRIARVAVGVSLAVVAQAVPSDAVARKAPAPPTDQAAERERMAKFNKAVDTLNFASSWIDGFSGGRQGDIIRRFNDIIRRFNDIVGQANALNQ
jgi:hypothetical protein